MTTTKPIIKPSSVISKIKLEKVAQCNLFKFDEQLQSRLETLLENKKANQLTPEESIELEEIGELDKIFTHINAMLLAQA